MSEVASRAVRPLVLLAISCSGAASLMYQVAWTRRLAAVTSATVVEVGALLLAFSRSR